MIPSEKKQQHVVRLERHRNLVEDLAFADAQGQAVAVQNLAPSASGAPMNNSGVAAVHHAQDAPIQIQPGVAQRDEALQLDQLAHDLRVRQHDDVLGFRKLAGARDRQQIVERFEELDLGGGSQQGCGNSLAHDVSHDHVQ